MVENITLFIYRVVGNITLFIYRVVGNITLFMYEAGGDITLFVYRAGGDITLFIYRTGHNIKYRVGGNITLFIYKPSGMGNNIIRLQGGRGHNIIHFVFTQKFSFSVISRGNFSHPRRNHPEHASHSTMNLFESSINLQCQ